MHSFTLRGAVAALLVLGTLAGCSKGGGSSGGGASIAPSTSQNGSGGPTGTTGTTTSSSTGTTGTTPPVATLAKNGPTITVSSPQRGEFMTQPVAKVEGKVTDPVGVAMLTIQGNPVTFTSAGVFAEVVPLTPGLNTIVIEAFNAGFRSSKESLSVVCGPFLPDTQNVTDALALRLNQSALDAIAVAAASQLGGATLAQQIMARNPLYQNTISALGLTIASAQVDCQSASFGNPTLKLTAIQGA